MKSLRETVFYGEAFQELKYSFGNYFLFDRFVVGEVNEDVVFTWEDCGKKLVEDLTHLYNNSGEDIVFISNRIHKYPVMPSDWIKFFKHSYKLKGYGIVSYTKAGFLNAMLEKLFMPTKFKRFRSLDKAIAWAKEISNHKTMA